MNQLVICNTLIKQDNNNRYSLNDLHKAFGGEKAKQPANWLRLDQTKELITEISNSSDVRNLAVESKQGVGTFVVKELVYSYAMWVSAKFHLIVVRTFDALVQMQHDLVKKATPKTKKMIEGCLTLEQQDAIKAMVACRTEVLPKEKKGKAVITLWSSIKSKYGLAKEQTYKDIPADQFEQVLSLVARVPLEGELLPKEQPDQKINISMECIDYSVISQILRNPNAGFISNDEIAEIIMLLTDKMRKRTNYYASRVAESEKK